MAVSRRRALLYGGYESDGTARVLELDDKGEARVVETVDVVDKGGEAIPRGARVWGIGARLYLHTDDRLLVVQGW